MRSIDAAFLTCLALTSAAIPAAAQGQAPVPTLPAGFAGSETCQVCHEDIYNSVAKSPHHIVDSGKKWGFEGRACEACHGPGQEHAESADPTKIRDPANLAVAAADKICLSCHLNQPTQAGRLQSSHVKDRVSCVSCHKVHANGPQGLLARTPAAVNEQCAGCHASVWAEFQRPNHHKLPEGAMSCVACHNPHGSVRPAMTQVFAANEPGCFRCHADKRGPFTFEHEPVRFEGCGSCHEAHGSANPRMLIRQEVRFVCLECHANLPTSNSTHTIGVVPPSFHDLRSPVYQNCTVCHQKVHGSYVDRDLLK
jgi:DmsE family decaheme c-type cytochrome